MNNINLICFAYDVMCWYCHAADGPHLKGEVINIHNYIHMYAACVHTHYVSIDCQWIFEVASFTAT